MRQFTLGNYSLDDFADFLNGKSNSYFDGIEGNELVLSGEHCLTKTLNINKSLTIKGVDAVIIGEKSDKFAFSITNSDTSVQNIVLRNFRFGIEIDGLGKTVENVSIKDITMDKGLTLVDVGSTKSNSVLRNITVDSCTMIVGKEQWEKYEYAEFALPFAFCAARNKGEHIDNCLLEKVRLTNCVKQNYSRAGILFMSGMPVGTNYVATDFSYSNLVIRDIDILNNKLDTCWDCGISITGGFINTGAVLIDGVTIKGNECNYAIGAMTICGGAHHFGDMEGSVIKNVIICENTFVKDSDFSNKTRAICINASRGDCYGGIISHNYLIENVEIYNNVLNGGGIGLYGAYSGIDVFQKHYDNEINNVKICNNYITNADVAFYFDGAESEGRMYDWWYGYPQYEKSWGEPIEDHEEITYIMERNVLRNITVTDNKIEGYRYRVLGAGAFAQGHGISRDNKVVENIQFERNKFSRGQDRFCVKGFVGLDYAKDAGGNEISPVFKQNKQ